VLDEAEAGFRRTCEGLKPVATMDGFDEVMVSDGPVRD